MSKIEVYVMYFFLFFMYVIFNKFVFLGKYLLCYVWLVIGVCININKFMCVGCGG